MQPVWFVVVRSLTIDNGIHWAYQIIACEKTTADKTLGLYDKYRATFEKVPNASTMLFTRDPDLSPIEEFNRL